MEEFKIRQPIWDYDKDEFLCFDYWGYWNGVYHLPKYMDATGKKPTDLDGQMFTGLKDKNGVDIYDRDIIKGEGVVTFKDCAFQTDNYPLMNFFIEGMEDNLSKLEVIGNIHENPELLKET